MYVHLPTVQSIAGCQVFFDIESPVIFVEYLGSIWAGLVLMSVSSFFLRKTQ